MSKTFLAAILAACLAANGCSKKAPPETEPVVFVQVAEVRSDSIQRIIEADGILHPEDRANVMPKISAPVKKFYVNRGDHVVAGQLLATLENKDLAAAIVESKGLYEQAAAFYRNTTAATLPDDLAKAQSDLQTAKQSLDAAQKLHENRQALQREGALAQKLVDDAKVAFVQAQSQYDVARKRLETLQGVGKQEQTKGAQGQLEAAKGKYQGAEAQLAYSQIRSPIAGVITDRSVYAGEMASSGAPLLTVMDISRVIARVNIPERQAAYLKVGNAATITAPGGSSTIPAKVTVVSPALDPNSTTVEIWVRAANPGERLKPGETVHVSIVAEIIPETIVIPAAAILPSQEGATTVMVIEGDSAHERKIEAGIREPEKVQVLKGLKAGERVVAVGGLGLQDGAKVRIEKPTQHE